MRLLAWLVILFSTFLVSTCSPTEEFIQGINMILTGDRNVFVDRITSEKFDPLLETVVDKLIFCNLRECKSSIVLGNVYYLRWILKEVYETISNPMISEYLSRTDGVEAPVWESHLRRMRISHKHHRNYTSTGIQFGDVIFQIVVDG
jgi:hypothetical protein